MADDRDACESRAPAATNMSAEPHQHSRPQKRLRPAHSPPLAASPASASWWSWFSPRPQPPQPLSSLSSSSRTSWAAAANTADTADSDSDGDSRPGRPEPSPTPLSRPVRGPSPSLLDNAPPTFAMNGNGTNGSSDAAFRHPSSAAHEHNQPGMQGNALFEQTPSGADPSIKSPALSASSSSNNNNKRSSQRPAFGARRHQSPSPRSLSYGRTPAQLQSFASHRSPVQSPRSSSISSRASPASHLSSASTSSYNVSKKYGTAKKQSQYSLVNKMRARNVDKALSNLMMSYMPTYYEVTRKGFGGSHQDYESLATYMHQVKRIEIQHTKEAQQLGIKPKQQQQSSASTPVKTRPVSFSATPRTARPLEKASLTPLQEDEWIRTLRDKIDNALKSPSSKEWPSANTPLYEELLSKDSVLGENIKNLQLRQVPEADIPALSAEQLQRVKEAMASAGTVVDAFNMSIKAKDIQTLKGSSWLNDEVINFYAELCMRRANESPDLFPKIHIFNTFFYEKLRTQGFNSVRRWTRRIDLFSKDYVIVPVHLGAHWTCAAISLKHKRFEYYDSLHGDNELCLELLRSYIAQESVDKKKTAMDLDEWEDYMPKDIPAQQNGFDCGVFTCMFMEHIAREAPFTFSQKHMPVLRQRIAYEILTASLFPR